jgi:hypothetical protein
VPFADEGRALREDDVACGAIRRIDDHGEVTRTHEGWRARDRFESLPEPSGNWPKIWRLL